MSLRAGDNNNYHSLKITVGPNGHQAVITYIHHRLNWSLCPFALQINWWWDRFSAGCVITDDDNMMLRLRTRERQREGEQGWRKEGEEKKKSKLRARSLLTREEDEVHPPLHLHHLSDLKKCFFFLKCKSQP